MLRQNGFIFFWAIIYLLLFQSPVRAESQALAAMDEALAAAETKSAAEAKNPAPAVESSDILDEYKNIPDYRKELEIIVREREKPGEDEGKNVFTAESYFRLLPKRKVSHQSGKVGVMEEASEYNFEYKLFDKMPIEFSFQQQYIGINNSTVVKLPAHLTSLSFGLDFTFPFWKIKDTYFRIGVSPSFNTDNWSFYENSFRIPQRYFAIYRPSDKFTAILGFAFFPRYRTNFLPIFGVIYRPNDKWFFELIPSRPTINYNINSKLTAFAEYGGSMDEFVVTKDDVKGTALEYTEQHGGVGLQYHFNKFVDASLAVGGTFDHRLQYRDSLGKVKVDGGFYTEFRVNIEL